MNIKLNNIFIERDGTIKISDSLVDNICFGEISEVVENLNDDEDENEINNFYLAPFVIQNYFKDNKYKIDRSYDFWCLGCSLVEILRGKNKNEDNFYNKKFKNGKEFLNFLKETKSLPKINYDDDGINNNKNKKHKISISENFKNFISLLFDYNQIKNENIYSLLYNHVFLNDNNMNINKIPKVLTKNNSSIISISNNNNNNKTNHNLKSSESMSNISNSMINRKNLGEILQNNGVINVLNNNEGASFTVTMSENSSCDLNKSENSSLFFKNNSNNNNNSNFNSTNKKYFISNNFTDIVEALVEHTPISIKGNKNDIYIFNKNEEEKNKNKINIVDNNNNISFKNNNNCCYNSISSSSSLNTFKDCIIRIHRIIGSKSEFCFGEYPDPEYNINYSFLNFNELYDHTIYEWKADFEDSILKTKEWLPNLR